jgi:Kef-type K+ transport system membrane component KefB
MKNTTPANIVGRLIKWAMELIGVVMVVLIMYGGVLWMTAQGSDEKIKKARNILTSATVGLAIVLAGWSITSIIIRAITTATAPASSSEIIDPWADE